MFWKTYWKKGFHAFALSWNTDELTYITPSGMFLCASTSCIAYVSLSPGDNFDAKFVLDDSKRREGESPSGCIVFVLVFAVCLVFDSLERRDRRDMALRLLAMIPSGGIWLRYAQSEGRLMAINDTPASSIAQKTCNESSTTIVLADYLTGRGTMRSHTSIICQRW